MGFSHHRFVAITRPIICVALAVSCGADSSNPELSSVPILSSTVPQRLSDGIFRLGLLLPQSGPGTPLGEPLIAIAQFAVDALNSAGGVLGQDVQLVIRDEGADSATALTSVDAFINEDGIDALIGPLSSPIALSILPRLVENGIGACSPAATTTLLASFPDKSLFIRTMAADGLASQAMAQLAAQTGFDATALAYPDDPYGRSFATQMQLSLVSQGITVSNQVAFNPSDTDYGALAKSLIAGGSQVLTVIGAGDSGARFLGSLLATGATSRIIVNDGLATTDLRDNAFLDSDMRRNITGVAIDPYAGHEVLQKLLQSTEIPAFSAAVIDCVNLLALAVVVAVSDDATIFMPGMLDISRGGSVCADFAECLALVNSDLNIDYNGPTGTLGLDPNGDLSASAFNTYSFNNDGHSVLGNRLIVVSAP